MEDSLPLQTLTGLEVTFNKSPAEALEKYISLLKDIYGLKLTCHKLNSDALLGWLEFGGLSTSTLRTHYSIYIHGTQAKTYIKFHYPQLLQAKDSSQSAESTAGTMVCTPEQLRQSMECLMKTQSTQSNRTSTPCRNSTTGGATSELTSKQQEYSGLLKVEYECFLEDLTTLYLDPHIPLNRRRWSLMLLQKRLDEQKKVCPLSEDSPSSRSTTR